MANHYFATRAHAQATWRGHSRGCDRCWPTRRTAPPASRATTCSTSTRRVRRCCRSTAASSPPTASSPRTCWTNSRPCFGWPQRHWTALAPLPGGDMPGADFDAFLARPRRGACLAARRRCCAATRAPTARAPSACSATRTRCRTSARRSCPVSTPARSTTCGARSGPSRPRTSCTAAASSPCTCPRAAKRIWTPGWRGHPPAGSATAAM